jgi:valyl-tRNA synthetase
LVKPRLQSRDREGAERSADVARQVLAWVLDQTLRLLHPITPFITEALWHQLNAVAPRRGITRLIDVESALIRAGWPDAAAWRRDPQVEDEMAALQNVIRGLRDTLAWINTTRSAARTPAIGKLPRAVIRAAGPLAERLGVQADVIRRLGRCEAVAIGPDLPKPAESATKVFPGVEIFVPIGGGLADLGAERQRLGQQREQLAGQIARTEAKLANPGFMAKAPPAVVEAERGRLAELRERLEAVERNLAGLAG